MVTVQEAEKVRKSLGVSMEQFSIRLGYQSPTTYRMALERKRISRLMAMEIRRRYSHHLGQAS